MTPFSNKFKKLCFWSIFDPFFPFLGQKNFFSKIRLCHPQLQKVNDKIQRKHPHRQMEGWMKGRTDPILWDPSGYHWRSKIEKRNLN